MSKFDPHVVMALAASQTGLVEGSVVPLAEPPHSPSMSQWSERLGEELLRVMTSVEARSSEPEPLLDIEAVQKRYGGCDQRTAREIMRRAGGFRVGRKLWVHQDHLVAHERSEARLKRRNDAPPVQRAGRRSRTVPREGVTVSDDRWFLEA